MPGLVLFKRRWAIGSDDFVFPSLGEIVLRVSWFAVLVTILAAHHHGFSCDDGSRLKSFYIGTLVLNIIAVIILIRITCISTQGTITDIWPRRNLSTWLYVKLLLLIPEGIWVCVSTYWAFGSSYTCEWTVVWTARGAVICSWIVGFIMFAGGLLIFDPLGARVTRRSIMCTFSQGSEPELSNITSMATMTSSKVWETRCRVLCCCIAFNSDTKQAFVDISQVVAEFFRDLDVVPTDIAAGLMLVQQQQVDSDNQLTSVVTPDHSTSAQSGIESDVPQPKSWMTIPNMVRYMKFAMGSYGWPFYIYENLTTGVCKLCPYCRFFACIRKANGVFMDNMCQCNTATIKKISGISDEDLIYATFHNKFKQVPFYVVVDREAHSVVLSIRGTLSFHDALADVSAQGAELEIPGVENSYCHAAMLDCANYILGELQSLRVLDSAFSNLETDGRLVITGHSLGAGVAAILAVLLKPKYPDLICFSFSPPGGLMSESASKYTQDFVCSVVVGKDLVPRLGMYTLVDLKVKILRALCQCNDPKYRILATGCLRLLCCVGPSNNNTTRRASIREDSRNRSEDQERVPVLQEHTFQDALRAAEIQLEHQVRIRWPMYSAGQILHVIELTEDSSNCSSSPQYGAVWTKSDSFDKIVISTKMVSDHMPNTVINALDNLCNKSYVPLRKQTIQMLHC